MTNTELLEFWQKNLGLQDWKITLFDNCNHLEVDGCGTTDLDEVHKIAVIRIIDQVYYGNRVVPFSFEKTLVHELLHVKFAMIDNTDDKIHDRLLHQYIDDLARAFVKRRH